MRTQAPAARPPLAPAEVRNRLLRVGLGATLGCLGLGVACSPGGARVPTVLVVGIQPPPNSTVAAPPASVRVTVSFAIDAAAVEQSWLQLTIAGQAVAGSVAVDPAAADTLVFAPTASLPRGVTVDALLAAAVRSSEGRTLTSSSSWSFAIEAAGASQVALGTIQQVWSGTALRVAPMARTGSGEIGLAFESGQSPPQRYGLFWSETAHQWSAQASIPSAYGATSSQGTTTVADGAGGLLALIASAGLSIHYGRDLVVTEQPLAFGTGSLLALGGQPTAWQQNIFQAGVLPASYRWDGASRTWQVVPTTGAFVPGTQNLIGFLPLDAQRVQRIVTRAVAGTGELELLAIPRDAAGVDSPPQSLGTFPGNSSFAACNSAGGAGLVGVLSTANAGRVLRVVDYLLGSGWSSPAVVWQAEGTPPVFGLMSKAVADSGAAVLALNDGSNQGALVSARAPGQPWSVPARVANIILARRVAVAADGTVLVALDQGGDLRLVGKRPDASWGAPFSLRENGLQSMLSLVTDVQIAEAGDAGFLVVYSTFSPSLTLPSIGLQSVEVSVQ